MSIRSPNPMRDTPPDDAVRCTVAIPVYNRKALVLRAVESALAQSVSGLEVLVVDNCSTDGTWEALHTVVDRRLRLVRNTHNVGLFGNFNRCLDLTSGTYLRFLCSDDTLAPGCLAAEIADMEENPTAVLLSSTARRVSSTGELLGTHADHFPAGAYPGRTAIANVLRFKAEYGFNPLNYPSGVLLRTDAAKRAGHFETTMRMAADVDYFFRVLAAGDLLVSDRHGCDITIHREQEGAQLAGQAVVMEEEYLLLDRFGDALESERAVRRVAGYMGGFSLRFALGALRRRDKASAARHLALARSHGSSIVGMSVALLRIVILRLLLRILGVRLLPNGLRERVGRRRDSATSAVPRASHGTHAEGGATGA
jgi:glycosyltransferase involved in cell wall biosynthesis